MSVILVPILCIITGAILSGMSFVFFLVGSARVMSLVFFVQGVATTVYYGIRIYNELLGCV